MIGGTHLTVCYYLFRLRQFAPKLTVSKSTLFPTTYSAKTSAHICPIYLMTVYLKNPVVCCLGLDYVCLPVQYKWLLDLLVLSCPVHRILSLSLYRGLIHRYLSHFVCLLLVRKLMGTPEWLDDRPTDVQCSWDTTTLSVRVSSCTHQVPVERKFLPCPIHFRNNVS